MADMGLSLDDIIKKSKSLGMRGRGGIRRGISRGARANGSVRGRGSQIITDARFKIIQKNREKLTDARDKLAEIAKQSDARLKLDKIRASHYKKIDALSGISRKTGRNGRLSLSTNKVPHLMQHVLPPNIPNNYIPPPTRAVGYRPSFSEPHYLGDMSMDYTDDYLTESPSLRRTVSNEYAPTPPPPPPVFSINPISPYTWVKSRNTNVTRIQARKSEIEKERERQRDYKLVARSAMSKTVSPPYKEDWSFGTKSRTIVAEETADSKYYDSRNLREVGVKSRLDSSSPNKTRTMGVLSRPKASSSSSVQSNGYRIVVSNLQANVTQEDIKELFEDVGELLVSRLVRPGTAEVIYKTLKDATKAVETYHNRQLDGHPMKCLLVNPRPKNNPTGPAVRSLTESRRSISSSYVQPSLGAVHRALFDDS
ncbi:polymerase delta-interacting protein 3-like isoform X1 [Temnothorax curvispinosus]|uniref:Polymerase delta-interacting protein 3-like isoform X1 n=1 Tax=Temnothorax curvispinosus TaxID=300111 RepID=A0A6J1R7U4_9HYME|nr:polymerase delta-interacting protein 3-like isoform X1 [Temnothorax curvispinosus]